MGYGNYSFDAHAALTAARQGANSNDVFTRGGCHPSMNPHGVRLRESRDCEAHPESLAIVFALDVSGSMETIPEQLAQKTLPDFMRALLNAGITDPQLMFMGIGNAVSDVAPLQVGQFESSESLIDQWLTRLFLEGGGSGGNENYELAMYFAARHTALDCLEKRHRRAYLFLTGDEPPNPVVSRHEVQQLIGDELKDDVPITAMIEELQRSYEPFYLIPDPGRARKVGREWRNLLGDRVVVMESPEDTSYVAAGLVSLLEEAEPSLGAFVEKLGQAGLPARQSDRVAKSLSGFAAALERDGTPRPRASRARLARQDDASGFDR